MTDEARRIYYSPAHWEKMLADQIEYIKDLRSRPFDCSKERSICRRSGLIRNATGRRELFTRNACIMRGCCLNRRQRKLSLLVNGINYGLMLDGLRQKVHADIDKNLRGVASLEHIQRIGRHNRGNIGIDFGSPEGDKTVLNIYDHIGRSNLTGGFKFKKTNEIFIER